MNIPDDTVGYYAYADRMADSLGSETGPWNLDCSATGGQERGVGTRPRPTQVETFILRVGSVIGWRGAT